MCPYESISEETEMRGEMFSCTEEQQARTTSIMQATNNDNGMTVELDNIIWSSLAFFFLTALLTFLRFGTRSFKSLELSAIHEAAMFDGFDLENAREKMDL